MTALCMPLVAAHSLYFLFQQYSAVFSGIQRYSEISCRTTHQVNVLAELFHSQIWGLPVLRPLSNITTLKIQMVSSTASSVLLSTNTFQMRFTSKEMAVLRALLPGFRAAKTKSKRADCLARAYIVFFSDFPIQKTVDMDEGEILWLMDQKKKVHILTYNLLRWLTSFSFQHIHNALSWLAWSFV